MSTDMVPVQVPAAFYHRLERLAALTNRPLESLLVQTLSSGLPPLPDDLPAATRDALMALESLSTVVLEQVVRERMTETAIEQYAELRERRRAGVLGAAEQQTLSAMAHKADLRTLRKSYAAVLLKWRGQGVPALAELDA